VLVAVITPVAAMVMGLPLAASSSATTPPPAPPGWTTVFSDGFTGAAGSGPSASWTKDTGTQYNGAGCTANFGTGEVESNTAAAANLSQDGSGHLNLTPVKSGSAWTSARIETVADNFQAPAGGELEVSGSIRQPNPATGLGYWPAFWMLGAGFRSSGAGTSGTMTCSNWPNIGEIDIMEDVNGLSEVAGTLHCGVDPGGPCNETTGLGSGLIACSACQTGFNTYSVIINRTNTSAESISWLLNGTVYHTVTEAQVGTATWQAAVDHGFFILLDVAVGGGFPNAICNCTSPSAATSSGAAMSVANVAVYQLAAGGGTTPPPPPPPAGCSTTATANISADCDSGSASPITVSAATGDTSPSGVDGNQVAQLSNGNWLKYTGVNFGTGGSTQFDARVASGAAAGVSGLINVVLDSPTNAPVGSFAVGNTGGWSTWKTIPANITKVTGTHTVYLEFSSGAGGNPPFVSLHYFSFPAM
jgi:beta-glucanase (GH16 family)